MVKRVSTKEARQTLGQIIDRVRSNGEEYIIERNGQAVAALVPVEVALQRQRSRDRIGAVLAERERQVASLGLKIADEELERLVDREVHQARRARRSQAKSSPQSQPRR
jgi:prevent-host-death family protein